MTDLEVAKNLIRGVAMSMNRFNEKTKCQDAEISLAAANEYLTGIAQLADFLVRGDGEVTAQQLQRAVHLVKIDVVPVNPDGTIKKP